MKSKRGLILALAMVFLFLMHSKCALAQEQPSVQVAAGAVQNEPDTQWAWGEVTSIDTQARALTLKYLDYETDQEKEITFNVDDKTTYENVKSFNDIKVSNAAGIDYITASDGKNIARNISVESAEKESAMPENTTATAVGPAENTSQPAQP